MGGATLGSALLGRKERDLVPVPLLLLRALMGGSELKARAPLGTRAFNPLLIAPTVGRFAFGPDTLIGSAVRSARLKPRSILASTRALALRTHPPRFVVPGFAVPVGPPRLVNRFLPTSLTKMPVEL